MKAKAVYSSYSIKTVHRIDSKLGRCVADDPTIYTLNFHELPARTKSEQRRGELSSYSAVGKKHLYIQNTTCFADFFKTPQHQLPVNLCEC